MLFLLLCLLLPVVLDLVLNSFQFFVERFFFVVKLFALITASFYFRIELGCLSLELLYFFFN